MTRENGKIVDRQICREGMFIFDRPSLDRMLTIAQSELDCRTNQDRRLKVPDGWDPTVVILVAVGIGILVGGAAFGVGYVAGAD